MGILLGIVTVFALFVFWAGYVVSTLWGWFVVPLGVVAINYWHAVGLMCIVSAFVGVKADEDVADSDSLGEGVAKACVKSLLLPAFLLCMGWLAHSQMPEPQKTWVPGAPGIPSKVMSSIVEDTIENVSAIERTAWNYVKYSVVCDSGAALVAVKTRDAFEHVSFVPVKNIRDTGRPNDGAEQLECGPTGFKLGGKKLSVVEVAEFALNSSLSSSVGKQ
ncbi:hypothetical protein [Pseudomonas chlororaphis]|uniref:hypothetical protein n=1 Tax=Pseudomonas chlororaphis TaxID=587753 RepID=UPI00240838CC|nr:hypothetical protein [Pseudomonas chlororaphis]